MKLFLLYLVLVGVLLAQQPPSVCGTAPHCAILSWTPGADGGAVTGYNLKRATTTGGPYTQVGSVAAPLVTFTDFSGVGNVLVEGTKYFWVVTATGPGGESAPSNEISATIPFSSPSTPTGLGVTVH